MVHKNLRALLYYVVVLLYYVGAFLYYMGALIYYRVSQKNVLIEQNHNQN